MLTPRCAVGGKRKKKIQPTGDSVWYGGGLLNRNANKFRATVVPLPPLSFTFYTVSRVSHVHVTQICI